MSASAIACDRRRARSAADRETNAGATAQPWQRPATPTALRDGPQGDTGLQEAGGSAVRERFAALLRPLSHSPPACLCGYGGIVFMPRAPDRPAQPRLYLNRS